MQNQMFKEGTKVTGSYFGTTFSGVVAECRPHTAHPTRVEHTISLDAPITVFSAQRERIIVATFDKNEVNKINAA